VSAYDNDPRVTRHRDLFLGGVSYAVQTETQGEHNVFEVNPGVWATATAIGNPLGPGPDGSLLDGPTFPTADAAIASLIGAPR
jgi:hypothetical protein